MAKEKLVRDGILGIIEKSGEKPVFHIAKDDEEYEAALRKKFVEEAIEFYDNHSPEELADIYEVADTWLALKELSREQIEQLQREKREKRGGFQKRIILEQP